MKRYSSNTRRLCGDGLAVDGDVVELEAFHVLRDGGLGRAGEGAVPDADVADGRVAEAAQGPGVCALFHVQVEDFDVADDRCKRTLFAFLVIEVSVVGGLPHPAGLP